MEVLEKHNHIDKGCLNHATQTSTYILLVEKRRVFVESLEGEEAFQGLSFICGDACAHGQIFLLASSR